MEEDNGINWGGIALGAAAILGTTLVAAPAMTGIAGVISSSSFANSEIAKTAVEWLTIGSKFIASHLAGVSGLISGDVAKVATTEGLQTFGGVANVITAGANTATTGLKTVGSFVANHAGAATAIAGTGVAAGVVTTKALTEDNSRPTYGRFTEAANQRYAAAQGPRTVA